jgi:hypothetical protein
MWAVVYAALIVALLQAHATLLSAAYHRSCKKCACEHWLEDPTSRLKQALKTFSYVPFNGSGMGHDVCM